MKVLLVGNYPPDDQKSMAAFSAMLLRELPPQDCEVRLVHPRAWLTRVPMPRSLRKWAGYVDKFVFFPFALRRAARWAEVVHVCDHSNAMYLPCLRRHPTLLTCHDVIAIQAARGIVRDWQVGFTGRIFQRLIARGFRFADRIVCVSQETRRQVFALALADEDRLAVIPMGLNNAFAPLSERELRATLAPFGLSPDDGYLLHVGHEHPRKNRMAVLRAWIELQDIAPTLLHRLVFVGEDLTPEMQDELARHPDLAPRVMVLHDVTHEALRALYCGAGALLFPSLQEGFGWPVIEAQACGCPVFTSDLAPMNAIGGPGAVYVDPRDPAAIAGAIARAAPDFARMRAQGLENAARYTPAQMSASYVAEYGRVIAARRRVSLKITL